MSDFWSASHELSVKGVPFVVVTMISVRGEAPQSPGAKAIVTESGLEWGTVGGGKIEARAIVHARELLARGHLPPELVTWNLQRDIGMTCGGEATYLFESHRKDSWQVVVFGAGHVGQAVVRALAPLSCSVICIDPRAEWVDRLPKNSNLTARLEAEPPSQVGQLSSNSFFVVMTQGHATDVPILEAIYRHHPSAPYVGVMGSDIKARKIRSDLKQRGVPESLIETLHCPIGLPLGGHDPAEIAISVLAELIQVRDRRERLLSNSKLL